MNITESTRIVAQERATTRSWAFWLNGIGEALGKVDIPGEFDGELAKAEYVCIESRTPQDQRPPLEIFVADDEEAQTMTPDELRQHAFECLAIAELAEVAGA